MEDHEKPLLQSAQETEARGEKWRDDEPDHRKQEPKPEAEAKPFSAAPAEPISPPDDSRYEFPFPKLAIFDLLGIQLAECTRMARAISDAIVEDRIERHERNQVIHAFQDVVQSSAVIADTMDLVQNGRPRLPGPQRSGRS